MLQNIHRFKKQSHLGKFTWYHNEQNAKDTVGAAKFSEGHCFLNKTSYFNSDRFNFCPKKIIDIICRSFSSAKFNNFWGSKYLIIFSFNDVFDLVVSRARATPFGRPTSSFWRHPADLLTTLTGLMHWTFSQCFSPTPWSSIPVRVPTYNFHPNLPHSKGNFEFRPYFSCMFILVHAGTSPNEISQDDWNSENYFFCENIVNIFVKGNSITYRLLQIQAFCSFYTMHSYEVTKELTYFRHTYI